MRNNDRRVDDVIVGFVDEIAVLRDSIRIEQVEINKHRAIVSAKRKRIDEIEESIDDRYAHLAEEEDRRSRTVIRNRYNVMTTGALLAKHEKKSYEVRRLLIYSDSCMGQTKLHTAGEMIAACNVRMDIIRTILRGRGEDVDAILSNLKVRQKELDIKNRVNRRGGYYDVGVEDDDEEEDEEGGGEEEGEEEGEDSPISEEEDDQDIDMED